MALLLLQQCANLLRGVDLLEALRAKSLDELLIACPQRALEVKRKGNVVVVLRVDAGNQLMGMFPFHRVDGCRLHGCDQREQHLFCFGNFSDRGAVELRNLLSAQRGFDADILRREKFQWRVGTDQQIADGAIGSDQGTDEDLGFEIGARDAL